MVQTSTDLRVHFPSLATDTVFFENAGGTQVPRQVIERMTSFLSNCNVQLGAPYAESERATKTFSDAHDFMHRLFGGGEEGGTILGASSSQLLSMLAQCYADVLKPGDEVVIDESGHEANINPWLRLEDRGVKIVWWPVDPDARNTTIEGLKSALTVRTRLVIFPHVSNLLGEIADVAEINRLAHEAGAEVVVDGVAYAPHGLVEAQHWDCDFYVASIYKIFGPHMAAMYGKKSNWKKFEGPNHFFIPSDYFPGKFELGCQNHEGCAGILGIGDYMLESQGESPGRLPSRKDIEEAWRIWSEVEAPLQDRFLEFLATKPSVKVIGPMNPRQRFGIVSFVCRSKSSEAIVAEFVKNGIACRNGHMYAYRLCEALGIDPIDGVVRISFVHYNTLDEVEHAIQILEPIL